MDPGKIEQYIFEHEFKREDFLGVESLHRGVSHPTPSDAILMHDGKYVEDPWHFYISSWECLDLLIIYLNKARKLYLETQDRSYLHQILVLLPRSWKYSHVQ